MCIAIPSKITRIDGQEATVDIGGAKRRTSLVLLDDARVGDYVIIHAGFAIQRLDSEAALETLALLRQAALAAGKDTPPESDP